jgi:DNA-binding transcriptional ArsR family regulator
MERDTAITVFETLASGVRLDIFKLLVRRGTTGMVAGEIGAELHLPATNLSFHLKSMTQANLLSVEQEGRYLRYRANLALMVDTVAFLTEECCCDSSEACIDVRVTTSCSDATIPMISAAGVRK